MKISTGTPVTIPENLQEQISKEEDKLREVSRRVIESFDAINRKRDEQLKELDTGTVPKDEPAGAGS
jgi:hypothetical protein